MSAYAEYWRAAAPAGLPPDHFPPRGSAGYLTFELDAGGLNNIRMQLEYLSLVAATTGRTLVLPPPAGWYLINWGPIAREGDMGGVSHHGEFFDIPALKNWINVLTTAEFVDRQRDRLDIPAELRELAAPVHDTEKSEARAELRRAWTNWLRQSFRTIPWNPLFNVLCVPGIDSVLTGGQRPDDRFLDGRTPVAPDAEFTAAPVVHFPCDVEAGIRQLGQISRSFLFPDQRQSIALWRMLRDGLRYVPAVFKHAARIIDGLGRFQYSSLHLRRNDFQYEVSRVDAATTTRTVDALLAPGEPVYIATDETDDAFFELISAQRPVHRYADSAQEPDGKLAGCVEQLVCAGGRRFIGTPHSSFTTYISRIRGYIHAPDLHCHDHTSPPEPPAREYGFMRRALPGRAYMREDPVLWEDAGMEAPLYSVVCTDTQDYAHWQCELLEYTWKQVAQRGELIRLVSRRENEPLPRHVHARVVPTAFSNVHPETGDEYVPYSRLFSFREWLDSGPEPGTVLILDPDCVFRDRIPVDVAPGAPIGQRWRGFALGERWRAQIAGLSDVDPGTIQAITWPALIHTGDLQALMPRWIELTAGLRRETGAWESDMMALVVAAAEMNLTFGERHLAAVMNWPEEDEHAPIVHYCQAVEARDGSRLWHKQGYRPWAETGASPADAKLDYCGDLLAILNEFIAAHRPAAHELPASTVAGGAHEETGMPERFTVRISLRTNAAIEINCSTGDLVLAELFNALVQNSEQPEAGAGKLLSVSTTSGREAHFHSSQIAAIETIPADR